MGIIVAILCLALVGSSFIGFGTALFSGAGDQAGKAAEILRQEYAERTARAAQLEEKMAENPDNTALRLSLADAYFDKAILGFQIASPEEVQADLEQAVAGYQAYLTAQTEREVEILVRLANAAQLAGQNELSEQTYIEILAQDPQNVSALYGYGVLLFYRLDEREQAVALWEKGRTATQDPQWKKTFEDQIANTRDSIPK